MSIFNESDVENEASLERERMDDDEGDEGKEV
jgi:hypothetical protein